MAQGFDADALGLPVIEPQLGETDENKKHRLQTLRNVRIHDRSMVPVELRNSGGWQCYFISLIRAVIHHPRVAEFCRYHHIGPRRPTDGPPLLQHQHRETAIDDWSRVVECKCGYCQLYEFLVRYWTRDYGSDGEKTEDVNNRFQKLVTRFQEYCSEHVEELSEANQQDAGAAFREVVNWLSKDGSEPDRTRSIDATNALFKILLKEDMTCKQCHKSETMPEHEWDSTLRLIRPPGTTVKRVELETLLKLHFEANFTRRCEACPPHNHQGIGKDGDRSKRYGEPHLRNLTLLHFPELLCIQLSLFDSDLYGNREKSKCAVTTPEILDLQKYTAGGGVKGKVEYRLYAVVKHIGQTTESGHYICYLRYREAHGGDTIWVKCDDAEISKSPSRDASRIVSGKKSDESDHYPYLLFYERIYPEDTRTKDDDHAAEEKELPKWYNKASKPRGSDRTPPVNKSQSPDDSSEDDGPVKTTTPSLPPSKKKPRKQSDGAFIPGPDEPESAAEESEGALSASEIDDVVVDTPVIDAKSSRGKKSKSKMTPDSTYRQTRDTTDDDSDDHTPIVKLPPVNLPVKTTATTTIPAPKAPDPKTLALQSPVKLPVTTITTTTTTTPAPKSPDPNTPTPPSPAPISSNSYHSSSSLSDYQGPRKIRHTTPTPLPRPRPSISQPQPRKPSTPLRPGPKVPVTTNYLQYTVKQLIAMIKKDKLNMPTKQKGKSSILKADYVSVLEAAEENGTIPATAPAPGPGPAPDQPGITDAFVANARAKDYKNIRKAVLQAICDHEGIVYTTKATIAALLVLLKAHDRRKAGLPDATDDNTQSAQKDDDKPVGDSTRRSTRSRAPKVTDATKKQQDKSQKRTRDAGDDGDAQPAPKKPRTKKASATASRKSSKDDQAKRDQGKKRGAPDDGDGKPRKKSRG